MPLFQTDKPIEDPLVTQIRQARLALASNDIEQSTQLDRIRNRYGGTSGFCPIAPASERQAHGADTVAGNGGAILYASGYTGSEPVAGGTPRQTRHPCILSRLIGARSAATRWRLYNQVLADVPQSRMPRLLGISVDGAWCHKAYAEHRNLHFSLLSDFEPKGAVARQYGAYREKEGVCERALFVIDKEGVVFWSYLSPIAVNPGSRRHSRCTGTPAEMTAVQARQRRQLRERTSPAADIEHRMTQSDAANQEHRTRPLSAGHDLDLDRDQQRGVPV